MSIGMSAGTAGRTYSTVGTRMPWLRYGYVLPPSGVNRAPASSSRSRRKDMLAIAPSPDVVRMTVASCITTGTSSAVTCTSSSMASTPCSIARRKDGSVFSGASAEAPRWPITGWAVVSRRIMKRARYRSRDESVWGGTAAGLQTFAAPLLTEGRPRAVDSAVAGFLDAALERHLQLGHDEPPERRSTDKLEMLVIEHI